MFLLFNAFSTFPLKQREKPGKGVITKGANVSPCSGGSHNTPSQLSSAEYPLLEMAVIKRRKLHRGSSLSERLNGCLCVRT